MKREIGDRGYYTGYYYLLSL